MAVFIADEQGNDPAPVDVDAADLLAVARHVLAERRIPEDMEVSVLLVDPATMASLNSEHMGRPGPTDVLAFPMDEPGQSPPDGPAILGDVVLCPAIAVGQAATNGVSVQAEIAMLTAHGILHLMGFDHGTPAQERAMFGLTTALITEHRSGAAPGSTIEYRAWAHGRSPAEAVADSGAATRVPAFDLSKLDDISFDLGGL